MPYYVFRVRPFAQIEKLDEFAAFKDASNRAKALRAERPQGAEDTARIKVMFAGNQQQAEDLLCQIREAGPSGDD